MKLYIPRVGDQIKLLKDWRFKNQKEYRNESFIDAYWKYEEKQQLDDDDIFSDLAVGTPKLKHGEKTDIVVPRGTVLSFDRLYIRKGASSGWDSVTFRIKECPIKDFVKSRFWVKIPDVNKIEYDLVGTKELLLPTIEIESLSEYDCRKGRTKYFHNGEATEDDRANILTTGIVQEQYNVNINGILEYKCILSRLFDVMQCQYVLNDNPNNFNLTTTSISLRLYTLDDKELFKVGAYSTLKTKIKKQYIQDKMG